MAETAPSEIKDILKYKGFDELLKPAKMKAEILLKGKISRSLVEEISKVKKEPD